MKVKKYFDVVEGRCVRQFDCTEGNFSIGAYVSGEENIGCYSLAEQSFAFSNSKEMDELLDELWVAEMVELGAIGFEVYAEDESVEDLIIDDNDTIAEIVKELKDIVFDYVE